MQERKSAEKRISEAVHDIGENTRQAAGHVQESSSRAIEGFRVRAGCPQTQSISELMDTSIRGGNSK